MSDKAINYIEVPASEVRRRVAEAVKWYNEGGRAKIEADEVVRWRNRYREDYAGRSHGVFNKRPWSEEEIEAAVDRDMVGYSECSINGNYLVAMRMDTRDWHVNEMKNLAAAATGDYTVQVRAFLWQMIVAHSSEPVAQEHTG